MIAVTIGSIGGEMTIGVMNLVVEKENGGENLTLNVALAKNDQEIMIAGSNEVAQRETVAATGPGELLSENSVACVAGQGLLEHAMPAKAVDRDLVATRETERL